MPMVKDVRIHKPLPEKHRLQIDLQKEALKELDMLCEQAHLTSRADAVRYSLRLFQWFTQQLNEGGQILVRKKDGELREAVLLPIQR